MKRLVAGCMMLAACGSQRAELPFYTGADRTPHWDASAAQAHRIAEFSLEDQDGRLVTNDSLAGHVYVANFFFTSCRQVCPKLRTNLAVVQEKFAADPRVVLLSHSVTPDFDSRDVLHQYAQKNGVRSGKWHLLRGDYATIERLARDAYFVELDDGSGNTVGDLVHTETFALVDGRGRIRGLYNGTLPADVEQLMADMEVLLRG
jgi:protein SCO1